MASDKRKEWVMKNRERQKENRRQARRLEIQEGIGTNDNGYTDLTPYNALMKKDKISKSIPTDLKVRVNGSFNG